MTSTGIGRYSYRSDSYIPGMGSPRALHPEQNDRIRERVRAIVAEHGSQVDAAKALKVGRHLITQHLLGKGAGHVLIEALRTYTGESYEQLVDAAAAAILAPRALFREALAHVGSDLPELARVFSTTETCMGLRIGEVTAEPVALVSPKLVRVRGDDWGWPSEREIRRLSRGADGPQLLRIVRLTDDPRRVFLRAA